MPVAAVQRASVRYGADRRSQRGWTLIELVVTFAVLAVVVAAAMPDYASMLANGKVRTATDGVASGLAIAQAEAMRRSTNVEFLVTSAAPGPATVSAAASASASNWLVRVPADATRGLAADVYVRGSEAAPSSGAVTIDNRAGAFAAVFTPSGRVMLNAGGALQPLAGPLVLRMSTLKADRPLCVYATATGSIKACDPKLAAGDMRACLPALAAGDCP